MITINEDDLPIVAAEKIVTGTRKDGGDIYPLEELREIAIYLMTYYEIHKEIGD